MDKYVRFVLKSGEVREFKWVEIDFGSDSGYLKVWEKATNEILFFISIDNLEYYERIMR